MVDIYLLKYSLIISKTTEITVMTSSLAIQFQSIAIIFMRQRVLNIIDMGVKTFYIGECIEGS